MNRKKQDSGRGSVGVDEGDKKISEEMSYEDEIYMQEKERWTR
ncbi:MAG: hypothetical protein PV340_05020 [Wolbachia sp.]|nr:hypothetical protein [Wolbachia sp.]MDD9336361.1 hypothetical protein [Wolbachia sp.]